MFRALFSRSWYSSCYFIEFTLMICDEDFLPIGACYNSYCTATHLFSTKNLVCHSENCLSENRIILPHHVHSFWETGDASSIIYISLHPRMHLQSSYYICIWGVRLFGIQPFPAYQLYADTVLFCPRQIAATKKNMTMSTRVWFRVVYKLHSTLWEILWVSTPYGFNKMDAPCVCSLISHQLHNTSHMQKMEIRF